MKAVTYFLFLAPLALAGLQARAFTFDGTLKDASDNPVTASAVHFKFQVRTPGTENCLLYEEAQTIDMTGSNGRFALAIGNGTGTRTDSHSWDLYDVFSNRAPFSFNGGDCTTGNSYTPGPTAPRMAQVSVDYGAGWETFPAYPLDTVPTSMDSYSVGGFPAGSLLRVADSVNLGNTSPISSAQYTSLLDLMNGNSGLYAKTGELGGSTLPTLTSGQSFVSNGSGGWTAFTPLTSESDPTVQAFAKAALPVCSTGEVLKSNGAVFFCVTDSIGGGSASSVAAVDGMNTTPSISFASDSDTGMYLPSADAMGFTTGGTEKMRINAAGKVGIGTTFPETSLQISASATSYGQFMIQDPYNPSSSAGFKNFIQGSDFANNPAWRVGVINNTQNLIELAGQDSTHSVALTTNGVPHLIVTPTGNLGINTLNPEANLDVSGDVRATGAVTSKTFDNGSSGVLDFSKSNTIITSFDCSTPFTFNNLRDGGSYDIVVTDSGTAQCNFPSSTNGADGGTINVRFASTNGARVTNHHTIYSLKRAGSYVYVLVNAYTP